MGVNADIEANLTVTSISSFTPILGYLHPTHFRSQDAERQVGLPPTRRAIADRRDYTIAHRGPSWVGVYRASAFGSIAVLNVDRDIVSKSHPNTLASTLVGTTVSGVRDRPEPVRKLLTQHINNRKILIICRYLILPSSPGRTSCFDLVMLHAAFRDFSESVSFCTRTFVIEIKTSKGRNISKK